MNLNYVVDQGVTFVEGWAGERLLENVGDVDRLLEACFETGARAALLYAPNMTPAFFDLSSGEAGAILQKLRNYNVRLAVVRSAGSAVLSSRFGELMADERSGSYFGMFETRQDACDWLRRSAAEEGFPQPRPLG